MRLGMVIDLYRCIGCQACSLACKQANNLSDGTWWSRTLTIGGESMDTAAGTYPNCKMSYIPLSCQHCENPACVMVCPVGATFKDKDTGVIRQDYDTCIGCRMCMAACPYTGVRSFNWEEPRFYLDFAVGDANVPKHQKHVVEKCTFCWHRLAHDEGPACMELCPGRARFWGDLDDPDSEVSKLLQKKKYNKLLSDRGTNPTTHYLI